MNDKGFAPIILVIAAVVTVGILGSGFLLINNFIKSSEMQSSDPPKGYEGEWKGADDTPLTPPQSVENTQNSPVPTFDPSKASWYKVRIKVDDPFEIIDQYSIIANTLNLNSNDFSDTLVFDTRSTDPYKNLYSKSDQDYYRTRYNNDYFVFLNKTKVDTKKTYSKNNFTINASEIDQKLASFLEDASYCQVDTDCVIRNEICSNGAYNHYSQMPPTFGCSGSFDENGCNIEKKYTGAKCQQNKCIGLGETNKIISCPSE